MPSLTDFCSMSERRTSGCSMMRTRGDALSMIFNMLPPCTRSFAYESAFKYAVDAVAIDFTPMNMRACSMTRNICAMPSCTSPTR